MNLMKIPITQSSKWAKLQDDLGEKSFFQQEKDYQYLAILQQTPVGNYLYCPYGPIAKDDKGFKSALKSLNELAREQKAIFIRVEPFEAPQAQLLPKNTRKSKDLNPKETWLLDLTGTDDELKAKLPSRLLRYYRAANKKGITIEKTHDPNDIHYLLDLQKALAKKKGISTFSEHYLATELSQPFATLYLVKCNMDGWPSLGDPHGAKRHGGKCEDRTRPVPMAGPVEREDKIRPEVIAAGLVFDDGDTRYNLQGAQSEEGRKLHATGILTIQLILDAKKKGLKTFDFWGIAPEGASKDHPWAGFTNFKKTFSGHQYDHAGTYDIVLNGKKYKLYQLLRKFNRTIRK